MIMKNQHVIPHAEGWAVKGAGNELVSSIHQTQRSAISAARETAIRQKSEMFVHGRNGQIRERNTYGPDPYPPEG